MQRRLFQPEQAALSARYLQSHAHTLHPVRSVLQPSSFRCRGHVPAGLLHRQITHPRTAKLSSACARLRTVRAVLGSCPCHPALFACAGAFIFNFTILFRWDANAVLRSVLLFPVLHAVPSLATQPLGGYRQKHAFLLHGAGRYPELPYVRLGLGLGGNHGRLIKGNTGSCHIPASNALLHPHSEKTPPLPHGDALAKAPGAFPARQTNRRWRFRTRQRTAKSAAPPTQRHKYTRNANNKKSGINIINIFVYNAFLFTILLHRLHWHYAVAPPFRHGIGKILQWHLFHHD